jgi:hypothetical protein
MPQSLVISGVVNTPQTIVVSGVAEPPTSQSIVVSGVASVPQTLVISGTATTPQIVVYGIAITPESITISGEALYHQSIVLSGVAKQLLVVAGIATTPITLSPSPVTFSHTTSPPQTVTISQVALGAPYTATSSDTSIATVVVSGRSIFVSPVAAGSATITVLDSNGVTATASVSVGAVIAGLVLSTSTITTAFGSTPRTFTATRIGDTGAFAVSSSRPGIVSISGGGTAPGPITYTVTPVSVGATTLTITASDGTHASLSVTILGTLNAVVTSPKYESTIVIAASEVGYSGAITASFVVSTTAVISPSVGFGPRATFSITNTTPGSVYLVQFADTIGNTYTLSVQSRNVSLGPVEFAFYDETGFNPVAAGSQYEVYFVGDPEIPASIVGSGFLGVGGVASLTLDSVTAYVITWIGQQAPDSETTFTTGAFGLTSQSVTVPGYRSPNSSTEGYAVKQTYYWTRNWNDQQYRNPGPPGTTGMAYNLAYSFAALLGEGGVLNDVSVPGLDSFLQAITAGGRLGNCSGTTLVSWFQDFLGPTFVKETGETDAAFMQRGLVAISGNVATRAALNAATNAAWQTLGNSGTIVCDDQSSNFTLMNALGYVAPKFVVTLPTISDVSDAFLLDHRYIELDTYLLDLGIAIVLTEDSVPPLVQQAVESTRALGTIPNYVQYIS